MTTSMFWGFTIGAILGSILYALLAYLLRHIVYGFFDKFNAKLDENSLKVNPVKFYNGAMDVWEKNSKNKN